MLDAGIKFSFFNPLTVRRPWGFHLRNHRKLCIIDGTWGFIGSLNISSEYKRWRLKKLEWIDNQLKVTGPAVNHLQTVFAEDWEFSTGESLTGEKYFPPPKTDGACVVQLLPTGPDEYEHTLEKILMTMVHAARKRVTMLTPYFVPTDAVALALEAAAHRGVTVDILLPKRSDDWLVDLAARSWYRDLLEGGANLYLSQSAFNHSKVVTVDGLVSLSGSANMDERSFRLNFECSAIIYNEGISTEFVASFDKSKAEANQIKLADIDSLGIFERIRDGFFRLLSPLL